MIGVLNYIPKFAYLGDMYAEASFSFFFLIIHFFLKRLGLRYFLLCSSRIYCDSFQNIHVTIEMMIQSFILLLSIINKNKVNEETANAVS